MNCHVFYIPLFLIILVLATFAWWLEYPWPSVYPVRGLDVSHHQADIEWSQIQRHGLGFVYVKASEGGDHVDTKFAINWAGAQSIGLRRGAYHFFTFCTDPTKQAQHFVATVGPDPGELPPAIDIEYGGNCRKRLSHKELLMGIDEFANVVRSSWGRNPILYLTRDIYNDYFTSAPPHYRVWIRAIFTPPSRSAPNGWLFWQYSSFSRLDGIEGPVDMNVFHGSLKDFSSLR